jgi:molybdopterin-containing oxidoreductase family membrane subunit
LTGLFILWLSATPDMAEARLTATGFRRKLYGLLAGHWYGAKRQWNTQKAGLAVLGAFYFMFLIYVQFIIVTDYAMSLVPGWKDSILPPLYSVTSFQSSLGLILIVLFILRRWGGYREYIGIAPFWSASKILLGLTLLWTYHLFAFFITYWYGRMEVEQNIIKYFLVESYGGLFAANFFFGFVMPFLILLWNPVRKTDWGPALAGLSAVVAAFLFNLRVLVGAFNAGDIYNIGLEAVPPAAWPDVWDVFMVLGGLGLAALVYLAATRVIPVLSLWEIKEGAKYQRMDTLIRGRYLVLAKPE